MRRRWARRQVQTEPGPKLRPMRPQARYRGPVDAVDAPAGARSTSGAEVSRSVSHPAATSEYLYLSIHAQGLAIRPQPGPPRRRVFVPTRRGLRWTASGRRSTAGPRRCARPSIRLRCRRPCAGAAQVVQDERVGGSALASGDLMQQRHLTDAVYPTGFWRLSGCRATTCRPRGLPSRRPRRCGRTAVQAKRFQVVGHDALGWIKRGAIEATEEVSSSLPADDRGNGGGN